MVSGDGMNPAMLCCRKKVKVRARTRPPARRRPRSTSGPAERRSVAMEKATARTVVNTGEYQAHPRRTPLNPRAAPATATATADRHHPGLGAGAVRPGRRGRATGPSVRSGATFLRRIRCCAAVRGSWPAPRAAPDVGRSGHRPASAVSKAAQASGSEDRADTATARHPPSRSTSMTSRTSPDSWGWSVTSRAKALAPNAAAGDRARASAGVRLPRTPGPAPSAGGRRACPSGRRRRRARGPDARRTGHRR